MTLLAPHRQVSYWRDGDQEESGRKQRTAKNETSMVLTGLEGNSVYLVTVKGFNSIGQGPATTPVTARTRRAREWYRAVAHHVALCVGRNGVLIFYLQLLHSRPTTSCGSKRATTCP